tara:strand:- start:360 stop:689 length:330 start_codon:yes stop_codon:yes gene_type:complete
LTGDKFSQSFEDVVAILREGMYGIGDGPRVGFLRGDFQGFRKPGQMLNAEGRCTDLQCVRLVCHFSKSCEAAAQTMFSICCPAEVMKVSINWGNILTWVSSPRCTNAVS